MPENITSSPRRKNRTRHLRQARFAPPVAFVSTSDAHALDTNPNKVKRGAARQVDLGTQRMRRDAIRARGGIIRQPFLATSWAGIPSLPEQLSKRPIKP